MFDGIRQKKGSAVSFNSRWDERCLAHVICGTVFLITWAFTCEIIKYIHRCWKRYSIDD